MTDPVDGGDVRQICRQRRADLGKSQRMALSERLVRRFRNSMHYVRAHRIALFWPMPTEVDLRPLAEAARADGKHVYLPLVRPGYRMEFIRLRSDSILRPAAFGIFEPERRVADLLKAHWLDTVCVPLLGFDRNGHRLGMGGGYYDRCFAFRNRDPGGAPRLIGTAFSCQELPYIRRESWDVRLDAVITEKEEIDCVQRRNRLYAGLSVSSQ